MFKQLRQRLWGQQLWGEIPLADMPPGTVGRGTYGGTTVHRFRVNGALRIGNWCSFASDTHILLGGNHRHDWVTTYPFAIRYPTNVARVEGIAATRGDVVIGSDVWMGRGATILSGVTIGHGALIGAEAVVSRDVPPYAIYVGNPAKLARFRFDEARIGRLLALAWWDWEAERVFKAAPLLLSDDIDAFLDAAEAGII